MSSLSLDLRSWLDTRRRTVDSALSAFFPAEAPDVLGDAMRYSLFAGGKRLRPMLVLAAAEAVSETVLPATDEVPALALPAACAVELIHTYSLVHDDLPAMDNDTLRRGRPTAHVVYGDGIAILAGDALLTEAFALLAREPQASSLVASNELATRKLRTLAVIAGAAGATGMVGGQAVDLQAASPDAAPLDEVQLRQMHAQKTGALIRASAVAGAVMAGASSSQIDAIDAYAGRLGLAFQIVDDILDVEGASTELGKTAGKDAAAGKPTYPALYGIARSRQLASDSIAEALEALRHGGLSGQLPAIAEWVVSRTN